jgi:chromosome segregation ATPase
VINHVTLPYINHNLDLIKELIENSEHEREEGLKQIEKLRKECNELRKQRSASTEEDIDDKEVQKLKAHLKTAYTEITILKKMIGQFSTTNVDQCANLGKEIISLQIQLDKQKTQNSKYERERSFSKTIGKIC